MHVFGLREETDAGQWRTRKVQIEKKTTAPPCHHLQTQSDVRVTLISSRPRGYISMHHVPHRDSLDWSFAELGVLLPLKRQQQPEARLGIPEPADIPPLLHGNSRTNRIL